MTKPRQYGNPKSVKDFIKELQLSAWVLRNQANEIDSAIRNFRKQMRQEENRELEEMLKEVMPSDPTPMRNMTGAASVLKNTHE